MHGSGYENTIKPKTFTLQPQSQAEVRFILRHLLNILHTHAHTNLCSVCSTGAHPLAERKEVAFPTKHCNRANMAPRNVGASGGFSAQHGLMSYRWLLCAMTQPSLSTLTRPLWYTHVCHITCSNSQPADGPLTEWATRAEPLALFRGKLVPKEFGA